VTVEEYMEGKVNTEKMAFKTFLAPSSCSRITAQCLLILNISFLLISFPLDENVKGKNLD
jgi:hypothetical protein